MADQKVIAVLATLDTKGDEAQFLREQLERLGSRAEVGDVAVDIERAEYVDSWRDDPSSDTGAAGGRQ